MLAFDFETYLITEDSPAPLPVVLTIGSRDWIPSFAELSELEVKYDVPQNGTVWLWSYSRQRLLEEPAILTTLLDDWIVGARTAFDLKVIYEHFPEHRSAVIEALDKLRVLDVQPSEKLRDLCKTGKLWVSYSLGSITSRLFSLDLDKSEDSWRLRYSELDGVPLATWPEAAVKYAHEDVVYTLLAHETQEHDYLNLPEAARQARAVYTFDRMSDRGLQTDEVGVNFLSEKTEASLDEARQILLQEGIVVRTKKGEYKRDMKTAYTYVEALAAKLDLYVKRTETKKPQLTEEALAEYDDEVIRAYLRYSKASHLRATVRDLRKGVDTPIHTSFNTLVKTGRTSSSKPNIQNQRREPGARECFVPRPGYAFVAGDWSSIELHSLAQVCISLGFKSELGRLLREGLDPHSHVAAQIFGVSYDDFRSRLKTDPQAKEDRTLGKVATFGFPGGMLPETLVHHAKASYGLNLSVGQASDVHSAWVQAFPEMLDYFAHIAKLFGFTLEPAWLLEEGRVAVEGGFAHSHKYQQYLRNKAYFLDGAVGSAFSQNLRALKWVLNQVGKRATVEQIKSGRVRAGCTFNQAANTYFQGLTSDGMKDAGWELERFASYNPWFRPVAAVHDEYIAESLLEKVPDSAEVLESTMVTSMNRWVSDVPCRVELVAMDRWSKGARELRDSQGRLQVFTVDVNKVYRRAA